jgi:bifunctional oligoribonuclease and PAP phosphatase NrnA
MDRILEVAEPRRQLLGRIIARLAGHQDVVLTTHVNADGDGAGSQAAVAAWLSRVGKRVRILNPTPFPDMFRYLLETPETTLLEAAAAATVKEGVLMVLDTAEPSRIGRIAPVAKRLETLVIDHHVPSEPGFDGLILQDESAAATGELIYDLFHVARVEEPWPRVALDALYTAIVTDTGSFRFSNTSPRVHAIAGDLLRRGVDPEAAYRRIYGTVPMRRVQLLRHALDNLVVDPEWPIAWLSIRRAVADELGATSDDLEGVVEHARTLEGTEVALLFREVGDGTKVSLRSNGEVDVNAVAREFGGGGHRKASGALLGKPLDSTIELITEATRRAIAAAGLPRREPKA